MMEIQWKVGDYHRTSKWKEEHRGLDHTGSPTHAQLSDFVNVSFDHTFSLIFSLTTFFPVHLTCKNSSDHKWKVKVKHEWGDV